LWRAKLKKKKTHQQRGRRNRQRGAELQRLAVNLAKEYDLEAHNRDRGGACHPLGDILIEDKYYGCKMRKSIPSYLLPEKEEVGVVIRADRLKPSIVIDLEDYLLMLKLLKEIDNEA
tara:strand:+ start:572 stop:922 length:351 start_codon:yes stop_codon:yes gene_type:complete